jgi:hypothetical protein
LIIHYVDCSVAESFALVEVIRSRKLSADIIALKIRNPDLRPSATGNLIIVDVIICYINRAVLSYRKLN